ncbi:hypothetical protein BAE44_0001339 [Dichanthelium oligosanthes]|uniref:Uncharacterized protein n=1 Tax=Dichanthelium oligosanthes TaxID=888268 RepID=A0A1E5WJR5_9POAL|nr:hypothetical protein BAE44_0001339 [Dichanthelium oligosanthes]
MSAVSFLPACSFRTGRFDARRFRAIDSRHGRVLLHALFPSEGYSYVFHVWNPISDERRRLPWSMRFGSCVSNFDAAVLCAGDGDGCDHLDCHREPFLVVFMATHRKFCQSACGALVENSLYFVLEIIPGVLKYDMGTREVTVIDPPRMMSARIVLMTAEGGGLGCVMVEGSELCLWSREIGPGGGDIIHTGTRQSH